MYYHGGDLLAFWFIMIVTTIAIIIFQIKTVIDYDNFQKEVLECRKRNKEGLEEERKLYERELQKKRELELKKRKRRYKGV